jgi:hypothetical protein
MRRTKDTKMWWDWKGMWEKEEGSEREITTRKIILYQISVGILLKFY